MRRRHTPLAATVVATAAAGALLLVGGEAATERPPASSGERLVAAAAEETGRSAEEPSAVPVATTASEGTTADGASVPVRLAEVVPVPRGFMADRSFETREDGTAASSVSGRLLGAEAAVIIEAIVMALVTEGWEAEGRTYVDDELAAVAVRRGDGLVTVLAVEDGDDTMLTLTLVEDGPS